MLLMKTTKTVTVDMDSAAGPRVTFRGDVDGERLRAAAPAAKVAS